MELTVLFTLVLTLNFTLQFKHNNEGHQDFFIFNGVNQSAYFFRDNYTLSLLFVNVNDSILLQLDTTTEYFTFKWPDEVNGEVMLSIKGNFSEDDSIYHSFTFLDPILLDEIETDSLYKNEGNTDYEYLMGIMFLFVVVMKSPDLIKSALKRYHAHTLLTREPDVL